MPRHFYLYSAPGLPPAVQPYDTQFSKSKQRFPIACIATNDITRQDDSIDVWFAVASYNPADKGILPFSRKVARARSAGRLNSSSHRMLLSLPYVADEAPAKQYARIMRAVCECMGKGQWAAAHPGAHSAIAAALLWLDHDTARAAQWAATQPPPPEPVQIVVAPEEETTINAIFAGEAVMEAVEAYPLHEDECFPSRRVLDEDAIEL